jgi:hypothetical protein
MKLSKIQPTRRFASPAAMAAALGTSRYPFRDHGTMADHAKAKAVQS